MSTLLNSKVLANILYEDRLNSSLFLRSLRLERNKVRNRYDLFIHSFMKG